MTFDSDSINIKRQRKDTWARYLFIGFGGLVLLTLVVLVAQLMSQALPLTYTPSLTQVAFYKLASDEKLLSAGDIVNAQPLIVRKPHCRIALKTPSDNTLIDRHTFIRPCEHEMSATSLMGENFIVDVSPKGQVRVFPVSTLSINDRLLPKQAELDSPQSALSNSITFSLPLSIWTARKKWEIALSTKWAVIAVTSESSTFIRWVNRKRPTEIIDKVLSKGDSSVLLPGSERVVMSIDGLLYVNRLMDEGNALYPIAPNVQVYNAKNAVFPLAKHRTFFLLDTASQTVSRWVLTRSSEGLVFRDTYSIALDSQESVLDVAEHASMNLVAILTDKQRILLVNRVSGEVIKSEPITRQENTLIWYGDKLYGSSQFTLSVWQGKHLSGATTWSSLFEPQHYEGYETYDAVWQTTSASDFQEAKFSLTPLLIGSAKASLLALFIAIPVAIGAAIYTGYFAKNRLRNIVKPAIELLEAIPSVLIGFIAAIWLSPKAEQFLFSFAFFIIVIPFILIGIALVQRPIAMKLPKRLRHGAELFFAVIGAVILGFISVGFAPYIIVTIFGIDNFASLSASSDSPIGKTTVVVALALGLAISPSIYSLAEDAIKGVPKALKDASFALGATRLQTLIHVVLQVALPGIVAAVMLGFGRAFGETMIVLMVTGNTPIPSWDLMEGLRALTANLAIELPEADVSSAHYQILFFTACILFLFTFLVNTLAELTKQRIRRKTFHG